MYKLWVVLGAIIAISGIILAGLGTNGMVKWQQVASSGDTSGQNLAGSGTIGILSIAFGIAILVGGIYIAVKAYKRRYY